jgi:hypothetical protein
MKKLTFLIIITFTFIGCNHDNKDVFNPVSYGKISEGYYMGNFTYQNQTYWCEIQLDKNKYEEWPSGGAFYQKEMSCLTVGTDTVINGILTFKLDSFKFAGYPVQCKSDMTLPGEYKINLLTDEDSIVFSRGSGNNKIIYHLKRLNLK